MILAGDPHVVLLDEPMAGISVEEIPSLVDVIKSVQQQEGKTVLMVEHHIDVVTDVADRIAVMHHGALLACDTPARVMANETVQAAYLGEPLGGRRRRAGRACSGPRCPRPPRPVARLQGVSFDVPEGGVTALLGRNGVGKTTTLRAIIGLAPAAGASRSAAGTSRASTHRIVQRGVGYVPEDREVFAGLTVAENLRLAERDGNPRYDLVYDLFPDSGRHARQRAGTLSGGEQQMLAIARALLNDNRILLIDEPTKGLAPNLVTEVARALERVSEPTTILLVEQNLGVVQAAGPRCDRARPGPRRPRRSRAELLDDPASVQRLLGVSRKRPHEYLVLLTVTGLGLGALYFLIASGLSLIYGLVGVLNFAHGAFLTVGAYGAWYRRRVGASARAGPVRRRALGGLAVGAIAAALVERVLIRPLYRRPVEQVLVTVGLALGSPRSQAAWGSDARVLAGHPCASGTTSTHAADTEQPGSRSAPPSSYSPGCRRSCAYAVRPGHPGRRRGPGDGDRARDRRPHRVHTRVRPRRRRRGAGRRARRHLLRGDQPGPGNSLLIFAIIVVVVGGLGSLAGTAIAAASVGLFQR